MIEKKLSQVPSGPGVYLFKGVKEKILYVGKAKHLRRRLQSYFQQTGRLDARKAAMVRLVRDFSYIITENELEALVLEANLIKQHKPRFNIVLRDDKNYPYLRLTTDEEWPRLEVVRRISKDQGLYFGPYVPAQTMWETLAFVRRNFSIRTCAYPLDRPMRPCIQYQMRRCSAPCAGAVSREDYLKSVEQVRLFLAGEQKELIRHLEQTMQRLSDRLQFEEAARIRDRISNIRHAWESQRVVAPELGDLDVIGSYSDGVDMVFDVFFVRNGVLIGTRDFFLRDLGKLPAAEALHGFIEFFYAKEIIPPDEIIVRNRPDGAGNLAAWLRARKGKPVRILVPSEGKRAEVLRMAADNAAEILQTRKKTGMGDVLESIARSLDLPRAPGSIGGFDVSTISGSDSVGAFVYWADGEFRKDLYRHLRIRGVPGVDDYAMMEELVARTIENLGEKVPDLLIIDGGKGQLEVARSVLAMHPVVTEEGQPSMLVSVAKAPDRAFSTSGAEVSLSDHSGPSLLLRKIRDEAHRFAVAYHRKLREKRLSESPLEQVPGIGKKRRLELLRYFGSIDAVRNATAGEIAGVKGMNRQVAEALLRALRRQ